MTRQVYVEYFVCDDEIHLFCLRADLESPEVTTLHCRRDQVRSVWSESFSHVSGVRELHLPATSPTASAATLDELDFLVAPLAKWSEPGDRIYLIPHDFLHYMPLHALRVEGEALAARNAVTYAQSASVLSYCRARQQARKNALRSALVLGDSRGDLPFALEEARTVARLFGATPYCASDVTQSVFDTMGASADIIHWAGHAYFDPVDPLKSGLLLGSDTVISARDIFTMPPLNADLVMLSGCNTGVNAVQSGDELVGLTRAFLYAGASSIIVSLWSVADDSTAHLASAFYRNLFASPNGDKAEALREAMLEVRSVARWASPYYWAPLVLIGG
jgi:CHAT domain-containing protein